jgi:DNA-binding LacI/PurR family transcriptional regulator
MDTGRGLGGLAGGLTEQAASWTGLPAGIAVALGNVDAHVTAPAAKSTGNGVMLAVRGTSTCHVMNSDVLAEVPGMCGVVDGGITPGRYGYQAGQSAVRALLLVDTMRVGGREMRVTVHDVAREAGVSIKTVSNVVRSQGRFTEATRVRVQEAIDRLGYTPNLAARGLRSGRLGVIGLIVPEIRNPYFAELSDAVMRAASAQGYLVVVEQSDGDPERELELLGGQGTRMVDGLLFGVLGLAAGGPDLAGTVTAPTVVLGETIPGWETDSVSMLHTEGSEAATRHLLDGGRRHIAVVGARRDEGIGAAHLRIQGYEQALRQRSVPVDEQLVVDVAAWDRAHGAAAIAQLLARQVHFDAVVAFNDALALGALRALEAHGFSVPEDVAITGFDDIEESRYSKPSLTSVRPDLQDIASVALEYLLDRINDPQRSQHARQHRSSCSLQIRDSSRNPVSVTTQTMVAR